MAEEMAKFVHQRDSSKIRTDLINIVKEKVEKAESEGEIIGKAYENDKWVLVLDSLDLVFKVTSEILDHNTGYENYEKIPLEIAFGVEEYEEWGKFDGSALMFQKPTIRFLKTNITDHFRGFYRQAHNGKSPTTTFVVLTEAMYLELAPLDRKICREIKYKYKKNSGKAEVVTFFTANLDKVQQRGMIYEFLGKINRPGSKLYDRIDDLYVPPIEYEEIIGALEGDRVVFITGTPEYGKTYTAVRLLWEYFIKGFEPIWIEGGEEWERRNVRRRLEEIESELTPKQLIYFEDPFGKTKYESRESLEREIGTIIDTIRNVEDVYVVITSREEVFKEFQKEHLSSTEIQKFEKHLNIKRPSYDYGRRQKILLLWAESKNCRWFESAKLRRTLLRTIKRRINLPTPLSIKNFVMSTIAVTQRAELMEKIEEKSKETARSFADEIENMRDDKILFLSFIFLFHRAPINLVRTLYQEMIEEMNLEAPLDFDGVLGWFRDDKLDVSKRYLSFSHPSYSEAINYLLTKQGRPTRTNKEIFSKVLLKLAETKETQKRVPRFIATNFDKLTHDTRELLFKLAEGKETVSVSLHEIMRIYEQVPDRVETLLLELAERKETARAVGWTLAQSFNKLPQELRNKLLDKLSKMEETTKPLASIIAQHPEELPLDFRNQLPNLVEDDEVATHVGWILLAHYDRLPVEFRDLVFELAKRKEVAKTVVRAIGLHFEKIDEEGRNLLDELQPSLQQVIADLSGSARSKDRRSAILIISKVKSKLSKDFCLSILNKMLKDKVRSIRKRAQKLIDDYSQVPT